MNGEHFDSAVFARFSIRLDQCMAVSNDKASLNLINTLRELLGYSAAAVRFECTESPDSLWINCVSPGLPQLEKRTDLFRSDPFCNYIIDNVSEHKFFAASELCADYAESPLLRALGKGPVYAGAFGLVDVWRQILVILMFKQGADFTAQEREDLSLLYDMLSSKAALRDRFVEYETLRFMKNQLFDSSSIGTVIINDEFEIVDSNYIFDSYYKQRLSDGSITNFLKSLLTVYSATGESDCVRTVRIGDYTLTVRSEKKPIGQYSRTRYYFITIDDGSGTPPAMPAKSDWRQSFVNRFGLSSREMEIVDTLATGLKYQEIADKLFISVSTVRTHVKNIYKKLGINNQRSLLYLYSTAQNG